MRHPKLRPVLLALLALQALGAVGGALFVVPVMPVDNLNQAFFADYTVPALALGLVVGAGSLVALVLLVRHHAAGPWAALLAGLAVMVFEIVEVAATHSSIVTSPGEAPLWQQPLWFLIGAVIAGLSLATWPERREIAAA